MLIGEKNLHKQFNTFILQRSQENKFSLNLQVERRTFGTIEETSLLETINRNERIFVVEILSVFWPLITGEG